MFLFFHFIKLYLFIGAYFVVLLILYYVSNNNNYDMKIYSSFNCRLLQCTYASIIDFVLLVRC